ncbi:hypothetical protein GRX01_12360 [Halobaculum sp. WSA2]|uniref:Uncharacterized protein n=1 Tax=Halobaculum saliterrae TaxID=2073113 RepID=A0A6B0SU80_9EURY|nr:hypothetical protein [Halobaculum saliterrae]MXR42127.1 hypothetical protein [Halobaculum saliterrae]
MSESGRNPGREDGKGERTRRRSVQCRRAAARVPDPPPGTRRGTGEAGGDTWPVEAVGVAVVVVVAAVVVAVAAQAAAAGADATVAAFAPTTLESLGIRDWLEWVAAAGTATAVVSGLVAVAVVAYGVALAVVRVAVA